MVAVQPNTWWLNKYPWLQYSQIRDDPISIHGCGTAEYVMDSFMEHVFFCFLKTSERTKVCSWTYHFRTGSRSVLSWVLIQNIHIIVLHFSQRIFLSLLWKIQHLEGLGLRGNVEDLCSQKNPGNCPGPVGNAWWTDSILHNHLMRLTVFA